MANDKPTPPTPPIPPPGGMVEVSPIEALHRGRDKFLSQVKDAKRGAARMDDEIEERMVMALKKFLKKDLPEVADNITVDNLTYFNGCKTLIILERPETAQGVAITVSGGNIHASHWQKAFESGWTEMRDYNDLLLYCSEVI